MLCEENPIEIECVWNRKYPSIHGGKKEMNQGCLSLTESDFPSVPPSFKCSITLSDRWESGWSEESQSGKGESETVPSFVLFVHMPCRTVCALSYCHGLLLREQDECDLRFVLHNVAKNFGKKLSMLYGLCCSKWHENVVEISNCVILWECVSFSSVQWNLQKQ